MARHLGLANAAIRKDNRDLADAKTALERAIGHLNLEAIAIGANAIKLKALKDLAAVATIAAGTVSEGQAKDHAGIEIAAAADQLAADAPVSRPAAGDIARADHQVKGFGGGGELRQIAWLMGKVSVHLKDQRRAGGQGIAKTGQIGGAKALFAAAVEHMDPWILGGQGIDNRAGAIGRRIINHHHMHIMPDNLGHKQPDIFPLIVGRNDDHALHGDSFDDSSACGRSAGRPTKDSSADSVETQIAHRKDKPMTTHGAEMDALELRDYRWEAGSLGLVRRPVPQPGPGQVLVRMAFAPINPSDLMFVRGRYGLRKALPVVPGFEGSGVVVGAGGGVAARAMLGRRVACLATEGGDGTWAEYMVTDLKRCFPLRNDISLETGASTIVNPLTAWFLVERARQEGHGALIQTAAAGQLGRMIVRLTQQAGLAAIHIVRREAQAALVRDLGGEHILLSEEPGFAERLAELAERLSATIAFDAVAGELTGTVLGAMPPKSTIIVYGDLAAAPCVIEARNFVFERKRVEGFWLADMAEEIGLIKGLRLAAMVQRGLKDELQTRIQARHPLAAGREAIDGYEAAMTAGKVLWAMGGPSEG